MAVLTGRVLYPEDQGWPMARRNYNRRFHVEPKAVVFCQQAVDVVNAVRWAREHDVPLRARSGRHSYEGYSLVEDGLVVDVSELDGISVDRNRQTARVGAGVHLLACSEKLGEVGMALPLGTGPTVGIAGLTLGGGIGLTSRKFGLTCDSLLAAELVTAEGEAVSVDEGRHPDLFWALRGGGGGNFGIVTSFTFEVHPVGLVGAFALEWPWQAVTAVVQQWQAWAHRVDPGLTSVLVLTADRQLRMYGLYVPDAPEQLPRLRSLLGPMLDLDPAGITLQTAPYTVAARMFFSEGNRTVDVEHPEWAVHVHSHQETFKATSAVAPSPLPDEGIELLKTHLEKAPRPSAPGGRPSQVQLLGGGGAISEPAPSDTAVYWRDFAFAIQYDAYWTVEADGAEAMEWVRRFRRDMRPYTEGAYVNYIDADIEHPLRAYYGENLARLVEVKRRYDPDEVFHFPQSIPTKLDERSL